MSDKYFSQFNQDEIINTLLNNKKNGFFIDVGAYDGITYSNSYFFEKTNNWSGVCFEPNPLSFKKLSQVRINTCINGGISVKNDILTFKSFSGNQELEMLSGFSDFFNEEQLQNIELELEKEKNSSTETIQVKTYSLNEYLENNLVSKVDYCSIDTEGGEFDILKTIDFKANYFATLTVENNANAEEVIQYMSANGFKFLFIWKCDLFFVNGQASVGFFVKLKLSKYYINYHLKKTGILYKGFNFIYKTLISKNL